MDPTIVEEAIGAVPQEVLEHHFLWGSPSRVERGLEDLRDAGQHAVCFIPASFQTPGSTLYHALGTCPDPASPPLTVRRLS